MEHSLSTLWLVFATFLVLSMQAGFLMLEGGRVRSKNSINVAQKNITDLVVIWIVFFALGFTLMFGLSISDLMGGREEAFGASPLHFMFQVAFCSTCATIVSGAVAERMSFRAYLTLVAIIGVLIYPVAGRLVWGNTYNPDVSAWLGELGFMDFAGGTVVHGVGAWVGLVAVLMIGPRIGRFDENGQPQTMPAHNAVIALFGVFVLMLGWLGFNTGTIQPGDPLMTQVLFNTLTTAVFGGAAGMFIGFVMDKGVFNPSRVTSGLLGGLVCGTSGINVMGPYDSMWVGLLGGIVATAAAHILLHKFKFDDPLDVVATHGVAGFVGTLIIPFVAPISALQLGSRLEQFGIQFLGVMVVLVFTSAVTFASLLIMKRFMQIRVSAEAEKIGLNYTEHGESIGLSRLQNTLNSKIASNDSFSNDIVVDSDDEHSELASTLNKVIHKYELASNEIKVARQRFQQFAETASDWLWETDENLIITFVHTNSAHSMDVSLDENVGLSLLDTLKLGQVEMDQVATCIKNEVATPVFEALLLNNNTFSEPFSVEVRGVPNHNSAGVLTGYRGTITDISVRKAAEDKALYLAIHDELTCLPNRRALSVNLKENFRDAYQHEKAVVVAGMDLDGFKLVNDAYGHLVGDTLLKKVATRLTNFLRPADSAYRTGGDEFVIVLTGLEQGSALDMGRAITERLIEELSAPYYIDSLQVRIGVTIGLSTYPHHSKDVLDLLRMADLALYDAKEAGKGRVHCFEHELDHDAKLQLELEQDLNRALEQDEFYLVYQPQVDAASGVVTGYEALIRWQHPQRGEIQPADFIAVADRLNLMDSIGAYVLDKACAFASTWKNNNTATIPRIAVNVSPQQFRNKDFFDLVVETLERHQLPAERLELEITEDVLVHDFNAVSAVLNDLQAIGVAIAVDDFGSGQTSLRYLNQFPLSTIKIDRSFIQHLAVSPKAAEITRTIVMLGRKLGINVLAEGVEQTDQLELLREWKCDEIQGFLFARPMSEKDVVLTMSQTNEGNKAA